MEAAPTSPAAQTRAIVRTRKGRVRGALVDGVYAFKGVPYGAPPFGPGRLRAPRPVDAWDGVRDALEDGAKAPQPSPAEDPSAAGFFTWDRSVAGEDCLNLTVWTPDPSAAKLPVVVWITGGQFMVGSASWYDGSRFARDGVVCVAINYRVGAEGFLHLDDADPNRGLLDQIAALEWVRDNISAFGGDPDNVALCGESAGAMCIGVLLAMPRAEGLFRRAILQSGGAQQVVSVATARRVTALLAEKVGVVPTREGFASVPVPTLLAAQSTLMGDLASHPDPDRWGPEVVVGLPWQPVVDGDLVPAPPLERIRAGASAAVDVLVGSNEDEWRLFRVASGEIGQITDAVLRGDVARYGYRSVAVHGISAERALPAYRAAYPDVGPGDLLAAIQTDWWCRVPGIRLAEAHVNESSRTFMYEFAWRSPVAGGIFGACHALEIPFVFDTVDQGAAQMLGNLLGDEPPRELAHRMHAAWVSFIARGDAGWPEYDLQRRATMRFGAEPRVVDDPRAWERALWEGVR